MKFRKVRSDVPASTFGMATEVLYSRVHKIERQKVWRAWPNGAGGAARYEFSCSCGWHGRASVVSRLTNDAAEQHIVECRAKDAQLYDRDLDRMAGGGR